MAFQPPVLVFAPTAPCSQASDEEHSSEHDKSKAETIGIEPEVQHTPSEPLKTLKKTQETKIFVSNQRKTKASTQATHKKG